MDLLLGAGPQFTFIGSACSLFDALGGNPHCTLNSNFQAVGTIPNTKIGAAAQARLRYRFTKTSMSLMYQRYETSGSGLFLGSQSDIITLSAQRPISRVWDAFTNIGVARNHRLQNLTAAEQASCNLPGQTGPGLPPCPGVNANTATYGFAGFGLHRAFGREFHAFATYQFNEIYFDHSYCVPNTPCNRISNRNVFTFGLDWTPRPIRID